MPTSRNFAARPLAQQVIVITGASSGIGLVTARTAAARRARVMLVARNGPALADAVREIEAKGGVAGHAVADVGEVDQVRAAAAQTIDRFGRIDTWVNNAGVAIYAKLLETPLDEHGQLFRTNYFGAVNGATVAVEHLRERGGTLITVASIAADIPSPLMGAYAASKHAVRAYFESLRIELNAERAPIRVTLVKPAGIDTPIAAHAANHVAGEALIPPPVYDPNLVAAAILDAAEHRRRDVTVGGIGRLQVLASVHLPGLLARFGGMMAALLVDRDRAKTAGDNLFRPGTGGEERSAVTKGRAVSAYAAAGRHRGLIAGGVVAAAAAAAFVLQRRKARA